MHALNLATTVTYDEFGRETGRTVTGEGVTLAGAVTERDAEGRRAAWSIGGITASAGYDAAGKLVSQTAPGISATYAYDAETARKTSESVTLAGQGTVASAYTYTDAGRLSGAEIGAGAWGYAFDERGNLESIQTNSALVEFSTIDPQQPDAPPDDRLRSSSVDGHLTTEYVNDALGRRESQTTGGVTTTFGWDDASRLVSWSRGEDSAAYTYDGNGQRTRAVVTSESTATTTTDYTYDGITLLSLDASRSDETTYAVAYLYDEDGRPYAGVYTAGAAPPVAFLIATTDRGDVVALTNTAGDVFARYTYDPYGAVLSQTSNAATGITPDVAAAIAARQPLRYAGYAYDAHSATYYLSQRHYDPATMRFLTKDPARDDGEESAYQYCAGDPVGKVDPTGEAIVVVLVVVVVGVVVVGPAVYLLVKSMRRAASNRRRAEQGTAIDVINAQNDNRGELKKATLVAAVPVATYSSTSFTGAGEAIGRAYTAVKNWVARKRKKK